MNVKRAMRLSKERWVTSGEVGLEIEVEGTRLPEMTSKYWRTTTDGSLQGESFEYVLAKPYDLKSVVAALSELEAAYVARKTVVNESIRAGVHVHINVQDMSIIQLYSFITLYLILEGVLVRWCGPAREGNLFCLRATDAEWLITRLTDAARSRKFRDIFHSDDLRYASLNVKAATEHGSLEFRAMRGTRDLKAIQLWVEILLRVRDASLQFTDPVDVITAFSGADNETFLRNTMGEYSKHLIELGGVDKLMHNGMRVVQDLVYQVKWETLEDCQSTNPFDPDGDIVENIILPVVNDGWVVRPEQVAPDFDVVAAAQRIMNDADVPRMGAAGARGVGFRGPQRGE